MKSEHTLKSHWNGQVSHRFLGFHAAFGFVDAESLRVHKNIGSPKPLHFPETSTRVEQRGEERPPVGWTPPLKRHELVRRQPALPPFAPFAQQLFEQTAVDLHYNLENAAQLMLRLNKILEDPTSDQELKLTSAQITHRALLSGKTTARASVAAADLFTQAFSISVTLLVDTLSLKLFRPDYTTFNVNAVREGLMAAIDALPLIGDVASAIQSIRNVISFPDDQFQIACDYLTYLENYIGAAELWNAAATTIITLYEGELTREAREA